MFVLARLCLTLLFMLWLLPPVHGSDVGEDKMSTAGRLARQKVLALRGVTTKAGVECVGEPDCPDPLLALSALQAETAIAVDSTGQHIVVGFNDFRGFSKSPISFSGYMYSDDGGATFIDGGQLPNGPTTVIGGQLFPQIFGDPDVKYIGGCTFIYVSLIVESFGWSGLVQSLTVYRSTDCGHTWQGPFDVPPAINPNGRVDVNNDAVDAADKELADVDPDTGRVMICWSNFTLTSIARGGVEISCTFSDNISALPPTFAPRRVVAAALPDGQGSAVRFAGNGSPNAYIAWSRFPGGFLQNVGFARSTDNGATWSAPVNLTSNFLTMDHVLGNDRVNTNPSVAVDNSGGPNSGSVYVVYSNNSSRDGADVMFQKSTNGGVTFSAPVAINSRPGNDRAQWFPYVTVDGITGRVHVFYYDQEIDTSGDLTEVSYLYSDDGGATWSKPVPITDRPFRAGFGNDTGQPNLGDYNQAVAQLGTFFAAYAETRQVGFADGQPSGSMTTPDVTFKKVVAGVAAASLELGTIGFTESGGDGNIDPGDQVRLTVPLINYVTNALNAAAVTDITATLWTTTPGATVTQAVSGYPSIAAGASAVNTALYIVQISSSFVPGTPIEFMLNVATAQGPATLRFTQTTGTPVYTTLLSETFDGIAPGSVPAGWTRAHGAGANTVPWTTSNTFCGTTNKAFHQNANDGPVGGSPSRWERLFSPSMVVPARSDYVTVDFDVCYDTEDDPNFRVLAYDGVFLRVTDLTLGRTLRSVLAEAFAQEFTTNGFKHYPKHFPRSGDPNYFEDMSAWAGFSGGEQHVHLALPGMAGSTFQLRFEYTQDSSATCANVRPGHTCGVTIDNVAVRNVVSVAPLSVSLDMRSALARDASNNILATLTITNTGTGPATNVQLTSATLNGLAAIGSLPDAGTIPPGGLVAVVVQFPGSAGAPVSAGVLRVGASYAEGNFTGSFRVAMP